jgi:hypothetical protein
MSSSEPRISWIQTGRGGQSHDGEVGGIRLFAYTWDGSKSHPGEPWAMTCALPGYEGKRWRAGSENGLRELAEKVLAAWLARVTGGGSAARMFTWDWKAQPPLDEMGGAVTEMSGGRVRLRPYDTQTDQYAWIVSDHVVDDDEARRIDDAGTISISELGHE